MFQKCMRRYFSLMLAVAILFAALPAVADETILPVASPAPEAVLTEEAAPASVAEEPPAANQTPATEAPPATNPAPAAEKSPTANQAPATAVLPAVEESPTANQAPATEVPPAAEAEPAAEEKQLMAVVKYTKYGRINMRAEPMEDSDRVGVLSGGTLVKVLEQGVGRWVLVEGEGKIGYMSTNFLELFYEGETPPIPVKTEAPVVRPTVRPASSGSSSYASSDPVTVLSWPVTESTVLYVDTPNGKSLNLRAGPSKGYAAIGSYRVGTRVIALARRGEWAYVSVGDRLGFMMRTFLSYDKPEPVPPGPEPTPVATMTVVHPWGSFVNLRSSTTTDTNKNILARMPHGSQVELLEWGFWYSLIRYNGITGYIVTKYLQSD